jgi:hypothetical protein
VTFLTVALAVSLVASCTILGAHCAWHTHRHPYVPLQPARSHVRIIRPGDPEWPT